jgi:hypothetical protein
MNSTRRSARGRGRGWRYRRRRRTTPGGVAQRHGKARRGRSCAGRGGTRRGRKTCYLSRTKMRNYDPSATATRSRLPPLLRGSGHDVWCRSAGRRERSDTDGAASRSRGARFAACAAPTACPRRRNRIRTRPRGPGVAGANVRSAEVVDVAGESRRRMSEERSDEFASPPPRRPPPRVVPSAAKGRGCRRRPPPRARGRIGAALAITRPEPSNHPPSEKIWRCRRSRARKPPRQEARRSA